MKKGWLLIALAVTGFAASAGAQLADINVPCYWDKWGWWWGQQWSIADWTAMSDMGTSDVDGGGLPDKADLALVVGGLAMGCVLPTSNAEIEPVFVANHNAIATATGLGPWWDKPVVLGMLATLSQEWVTAIKAQYPVLAGVTLTPFSGFAKSGEPLSASGDLDGDGLTNAQEFDAVISGSTFTDDQLLAFAQAASTPGETTNEPDLGWFNDKYGWLTWSFGNWSAEWAPLLTYTTSGDADGGGIPDRFEIALYMMAASVDGDGGPLATLWTQNAQAMMNRWAGGAPWYNDPKAPALGAFCALSQAHIDAVVAGWNGDVANMGMVPYTSAGKNGNEPFSPDGDFDNDGFTNYQEYLLVAEIDGTPEYYAQIAGYTNTQFWPENPGVPVAGTLGLSLLAAAFGLGGIVLSGKKRS